MSHSQIHYDQYVLRHAWLNLLSKHITAGRINQVTVTSTRSDIARAIHIELQ